MGNKRPLKRDIRDKKPQLFLMYLESKVRPTDGDGIYQVKNDIFLDWQKLNDKRITDSYDREIIGLNSKSELSFFLYEKKKIFDRAILNASVFEKYPGKYKQALRPYEAKNYTDLERRNDITNIRFELRYISCVGMWLAYAMVSTDLGEASYISDVVSDCIDRLSISSVWMKKFQYDKDSEESIANIFLLTLATAFRVLFEAQREENMDVPSSINNEDIQWFLEMIGIAADDRLIEDKHEKESEYGDYPIVEEKIIRYIWETNRHIFDHHHRLARRENVLLSDYYVVPALSCLNDKSAMFILDRNGDSPVRASLCAASGFGKSTLFLAILYCSTLDKAVEYGIVSSAEERAYRALQEELIGKNKVFPQYLPVVITGSKFSSSKASSFVELFSQEVFPVDENTPEDERADKKKWKHILKEMVETQADQVLFFCDAFDECESAYRNRYAEKFREVVNHPKGYNVLLSYRPFCDEGLINWREHKKWTILPLNEWGVDQETQKDKGWLMIRKTTDSIVYFDADESQRYADRIYERMNSLPVLKVFSSSPYLLSTYTSLCVDSKGNYHERTVYEMIRDVVQRMFARFNPDKEYDLDAADFMEICCGIALRQITKDSCAINPRKLSDVFCEIVKERYEGKQDKLNKVASYFYDQMKCEDINSKSGVLILNEDHSGYVFQADSATLPYLASLEAFLGIYNIVQDADGDLEEKELDEGRIVKELSQILKQLNKEQYIFVPLLIARICDGDAGKTILKPRRKKICQIVFDCANKFDISNLMEILRDRKFANTPFREELF